MRVQFSLSHCCALQCSDRCCTSTKGALQWLPAGWHKKQLCLSPWCVAVWVGSAKQFNWPYFLLMVGRQWVNGPLKNHLKRFSCILGQDMLRISWAAVAHFCVPYWGAAGEGWLGKGNSGQPVSSELAPDKMKWIDMSLFCNKLCGACSEITI